MCDVLCHLDVLRVLHAEQRVALQLGTHDHGGGHCLQRGSGGSVRRVQTTCLQMRIVDAHDGDPQPRHRVVQHPPVEPRHRQLRERSKYRVAIGKIFGCMKKYFVRVVKIFCSVRLFCINNKNILLPMDASPGRRYKGRWGRSSH